MSGFYEDDRIRKNNLKHNAVKPEFKDGKIANGSKIMLLILRDNVSLEDIRKALSRIGSVSDKGDGTFVVFEDNYL